MHDPNRITRRWRRTAAPLLRSTQGGNSDAPFTLKLAFPAAVAQLGVRITSRMSDLTKKSCKMCCMEIPKEARKCPFCQHFQNRLSMVMFHPAFAVLCACVPLVVMLVVFGTIFDQGEDFQSYKGQIEIAESEIAFGDTESAATVSVMGTITNTSPVPWKEIYFQVDFFDAAGRRADVGQKERYSFYLPAEAATSFKVSFRREFAETNYVKHNVRVLTAKDARARW